MARCSRRPSAGGGPFYDVSANYTGGPDRPPDLPGGLRRTRIRRQHRRHTTRRGSGGRRTIGGFTLFNTIVPPTSTQYTVRLVRTRRRELTNASDGQYQNANSNHPGGANFLFADGSVHFLKSSISIKTYWALGTKANGEVISSDSY